MYEIPWWKVKLTDEHLRAFKTYLASFRATNGFDAPMAGIGFKSVLKLDEDLREIEFKRLLSKENKNKYTKIK